MQLKRIGLLVVALGVACGGSAGVVPWTGGGGDGAWSNGANWEGGAAPQAADTAQFRAAATVKPPESFAGVLAVTDSATVTVDVEGARAFSSAVAAGAKLMKSGAGVLTLKAAPGPYSGEISVAAGTVRFAGNGPYAAPGLFGRLTVAPGARAEVADSPAETRHGALSVAVDRNGSSLVWSDFESRYSTFAGFAAAWDGIQVTDDNQRVVYLPTAERPLFAGWGNEWMPTYYQWRDNFDVHSRAIFLVPASGRVDLQMRADDFAYLYVDGQQVLSGDNNYQYRRPEFSAGWHTLDAVLAENGGNEYLRLILSGSQYGDVSRVERDLLWKGVCFGDLVLPAGAELSVEAGQAVAFVAGGATDVKGAVTGGEGAVFTVAGGALAASATSFEGFAGRVEVARLASLALADLPAEPGFAVEGAGRIPLALSPALGAGFAGTIDVPAGSVFTNTLAEGASFTGAGTLVTPTLAGTAGFAGTVVLRGDADVTADAALPTAAEGLTLADGASLRLGRTALIEQSASTRTGLVAGDWTFNGRSLSNGSGAFTGHAAHLDGDALVLTDDGGAQRNSAIFTRNAISAGGACEFSFVYSCEMANRYESEVRAEGAAFFFTTQADGLGDFAEAYPNDAYGFALYQYRGDGTQGLRWIIGGSDAGFNAPDYPEWQMGLSLERPIAVTVRLDGGVLAVELTQDGRTFRTSCDMGFVFTGGPYFFGISGGTGHWGDPPAATIPYCVQTITDFTCAVRGAGEEKEGYLPVSAETWRLKETGVEIVNGDELHFIWTDPCDGYAVCRQKLPVRQAFTLTFDECLDDVQPNDDCWAEGVTVFLTPDGDSVSNDGYRHYPNLGRDVAFGHYYWENRFFWSHNGSARENDWSEGNPGGIPKELGVNRIRLDYNGAGTFTATVTRGTRSWTSTRTYPDVLTWGDEMSLGFMAGASGWGAYLETRVANPRLVFHSNPGAVLPALAVEAGASAAVTLGNIEGTAARPTLSAASALLGAGSVLAVAGEADHRARLALDDVTVPAGGATLAVAESAVVELGDVRAEGTLTVTGPWTGAPVFHVAGRIGSGMTLAELSPEAYAGEGEPAFKAVDGEGRPISGGFRLIYRNGLLRLVPSGCAIYIR
ncbi:MAG: hypothetical protein ACI4RA_08500 [Kiritimatiellia bacterium]